MATDSQQGQSLDNHWDQGACNINWQHLTLMIWLMSDMLQYLQTRQSRLNTDALGPWHAQKAACISSPDISISGATLSTFIPFPLLFQCECALMCVFMWMLPCFHRHDFPFQPFFQITVSLNVSLNVSIMFRLVVQSGSTFRSTSFNSHVSADTDHSKSTKHGPGGSKATLLRAPETSGLLHQWKTLVKTMGENQWHLWLVLMVLNDGLLVPNLEI